MSMTEPHAPPSPRLFGQRGESSKRPDERGVAGGSNPAQTARRKAIHKIHSTLAPRIAVINSPDVDDLLAVNNIDSLADFFRPFGDAADNISVRTSQLETRQCPTFPLQFDDLEAFCPVDASAASKSDSTLFTPADLVASAEKTTTPETPGRVRRKRRRRQDDSTYGRPEMLLDAISARIRAKSRALWALREDGGKGANANDGSSRQAHRRNMSKAYQVDHGLGFFATPNADILGLAPGQGHSVQDQIDRYRRASVEDVTPWYTDMRDMVLQGRAISEHETFGHPVAVILAVSSSSPDPLNAFTRLYEDSQVTVSPAFSQRPYVDPLVFRYYLLIHDVAKAGTDLSDSIALLDTIKKTYGNHCCLLQLNSAGSLPGEAKPTATSEEISKLWSKTCVNKSVRSNGADAGAAPATPSRDGVSSGAQDESNDSQLSVAWHGDEQNGDEVFGSLLDDNDVRRVRTFVRDFAAQSLVPFMERCVSWWNEQLAASRKGLTNRLFGAGRKLFGSTRGSQQQSSTSFAVLGYYPHTAIEAQTRRLADFAFTTRDYRLAADMYDYGRRDYLNDKAYRFSAGANEMFGLSHLMMMLNNQSALIDVDSYLATAVHDYMLAPRQTGSALQLDGLRSTLLYYECYQALNYYRSAPAALVRTAGQGTSDNTMDDLEVVAAMLLEQAALSALRQPLGPALRKCALHLVMAAHRYGACGQKHLSLRNFHSAAFCYSLLRKSRDELDTGTRTDQESAKESLADESRLTRSLQSWNYIDDHMELELAQQAYNDGRTDEAVRHYLLLLQRQSSFNGLASPEEDALRHSVYLAGFLTCSRFLDNGFPASLAHLDIKPTLHLIDVEQTRIGVNAVQHLETTEWQDLQREAFDHAPIAKKEAINTTAIHEAFCVYVVLKNPMCVSLALRSLSLIFADVSNDTSVTDDSLKVDTVEEVVLQPREERMLVIAVTSTSARTLRCAQVTYSLSDNVHLIEELDSHGRRLNDTKQQRASNLPEYGPDPSTMVVVRESAASMHASFPHASTQLALGEEVRRSIVLKNAGRNVLHNIRAYVSPSAAVMSANLDAKSCVGSTSMSNSLAAPAPLTIPLPGNGFEAQSATDFAIKLRGQSVGHTTVRILIVYETLSGDVYTTQVQHTLQVHPVLDIGVHAVPTPSVTDASYDLRLFATSLLDGSASVAIDSVAILAPVWSLCTDGLVSPLLDTNRYGETREQLLQLRAVADTAKIYEAASRSPSLEQLRALLRGKGIDASTSTSELTTSIEVTDSTGDNANLSSFYQIARREYRIASLNREFPSLADRATRIFEVYDSDHIDILVNWRINGTERRGQVFIFGFRLGPLHDLLGDVSPAQHVLGAPENALTRQATTRTMYAETDRQQAALASQLLSSRLAIEDDPILLEYDVPFDIVADEGLGIEEGSSQVIKISLVVKNLSALRTRRVVLQLDNNLPTQTTTSSSIPSLRRDASSASHVQQHQQPTLASFVNRLTLRATLAPHERATLEAQVRVSRSGPHTLAPVLLKSTPDSTTSAPWHEFQRWEHCAEMLVVRGA